MNSKQSRVSAFGKIISRSVSLTALALTSMASANAAEVEARAAADSDMSFDEIVVTAQKREENLKDVPISITVLSGDKLDRSTSQGVADVLKRVPGVTTGQVTQGGETQFSIRGVTANAPLFNGSSPIGYYIDSLPFSLVRSAIAPDSNAYDLERVEVLRGPQGTLYGASSLNGVIRVLTRDPDLDDFDFKARLGASTTDHGNEGYRGDMAANLPISPGKLAARIVYGYQDAPGWIDRPGNKDANDGTLQNLRIKLKAQPVDELSIVGSAWISRSDFGAPNKTPDNRTYPGTPGIDEFNSSDYNLFGLRVGYDFGTVSVISSTSYLDYSNRGNEDLTGGAELFTRFDSSVFTEELVLNSTGDGPWRWTLGGIYRNGKDETYQTLTGLTFPLNWTDRSESFAVFGEVATKFLDDQLELAAGLRYFHDTVEVQEKVRLLGDGQPLLYLNDKFEKVTPRVVLSWFPTPNLTAYASYSKGFRSGFGQNPLTLLVAPNFPELKPDSLSSYEVGIKGGTPDRVLTFDAAVYYMDWPRIQQRLGLLFNGVGLSAPVNAGSASGFGVDLQFEFHPSDAITLGANASWNNLEYDEDLFATDVTPNQLLFARGDHVAASPDYTLGGYADLNFPLNESVSGFLTLTGNYTSPRPLYAKGATSRVVAESGALFLADVTLGVEAGDHWRFSVFANNLSNESRPEAVDVFNPINNVGIRPRTVGAQVEYRF